MAAWLRVRPGPAHLADALAWLHGDPVMEGVMAALRGALLPLWHEAWQAGADAAAEMTGKIDNLPPQLIADRIARLQAKWLQEVTATRINRIAQILANGGGAAELEAAIRAVLESQADAGLIAVTEVTRAMNAAAMEAYRAAGIHKVRWVTRSGNPCPKCLANEAAGPWWLGEPFPSGSISPPEHPNCQCVLIPADGE